MKIPTTEEIPQQDQIFNDICIVFANHNMDCPICISKHLSALAGSFTYAALDDDDHTCEEHKQAG